MINIINKVGDRLLGRLLPSGTAAGVCWTECRGPFCAYCRDCCWSDCCGGSCGPVYKCG